MSEQKTIERSIAETIKAIRTSRGETLEEFSEVINSTPPLHLRVQKSVLSKYELGSINPPARMYLKIMSLKP